MPVDSAVQTPRVRTRHGCWTCRKRRRKCDEKKPRCQNCTDKKRECQYGLQLAFLETNMITLMPNEAEDLDQRAPADGYPDLKFVDGMKKDSPRSSGYIDIEEDQDMCNSDTPNESGRTTSPLEAGRSDSNDAAIFFQAAERGTPTEAVGQSMGPAPMSGREIHSHIEVDPEDIWSPIPPNDYHPQHSSLSWHGQSPILTQHYGSKNTYYEDILLTLGSKHLQKKLLKSFIDEVLPWLELNSPGSPYSAYLPMLSSKYPPLRVAILTLAAFHLEDATKHEVYGIVTKSLPESHIFGDQREATSARNLLLIVQLLFQPFQSWRSILADWAATLEVIPITPGISLSHREASSLAMLRFDLATSVINRQPLLTNLQNWPSIEISAVGSNIEDVAATRLLLCAHISNLTFANPNPSTSTSTPSSAEIWLSLSNYLHNLTGSVKSPIDLSPLLNLQIDSIRPSTSSFLLQIHTTRLTFYAALLTHLSTLLLLQSRSQLFSFTKNHHSSHSQNSHPHHLNNNLKTPTWHALQICGLAVSNNIHWSWDPVVLAALLCAGNLLSFRLQQEELMRFLRRLRELTGWDFDLQLRDLEGVWDDMYL